MTSEPSELWCTRKIVTTSGFTILARISVPCLNVLLVLAIARWHGPDLLGQYTFLLTLYLLFESLKALGLNTLALKQVSKTTSLAAKYHASLWHIGKLGAIFSSFIILGLFLIYYGFNPMLILAAVVLCAGLFPSALVVANETIFLATGRADLLLKVCLSEGIGRFLISISALAFFNGGVVTLVCIYALSRWCAAQLGLYLLKLELDLTSRPHLPVLTNALLKRSSQFFPIFALPLLLYRMDILFLGLIAGDHEVGIYGVAIRLFTVAMIVPDGILTACFPPLSHLGSQSNPHHFMTLIEKTSRILGVALISAAGFGILAASWIIEFLFGNEFSASGPALSIILCALVPLAFNRIIGDGLVALGEQRRVARSITTGTLFSLLAYPVLIHLHGIQGAAWGFLLSALVLLATVGLQAQRASVPMPFPSLAPALIPIVFLVAGAVIGNQGHGSGQYFIFIALLSAWALFLFKPSTKASCSEPITRS